MLIDANAYIGHWPFRYRRYREIDALLGRMDEFGVDLSLVSQLNGVFYKNTQKANEELYETIRSSGKYRGRFLPFAVINPIYGGWKDDFKTCTGRFGMKGIRLYPKYHGYSLEDPACVELVRMARDQDLPVALSLRLVDRRPSSWMDLMEEWSLRDVLPIIRQVPDAKYLILNVANSTHLDEAGTSLIRKSHVIMDTSGRALTDLPALMKTLGPDKFAFGTHSPFLDYCTGWLRIASLRPEEADKNTMGLLQSGNVKKLLGL